MRRLSESHICPIKVLDLNPYLLLCQTYTNSALNMIFKLLYQTFILQILHNPFAYTYTCNNIYSPADLFTLTWNVPGNIVIFQGNPKRKSNSIPKRLMRHNTLCQLPLHAYFLLGKQIFHIVHASIVYQ